MNLNELLSDLQSKPDVIETMTPNLVQTLENVKKYDVPIIRQIGDNLVQGASQPIVVIDHETDTEQAFYNIKKNFSESVRDPMYTDQQYASNLESTFTGWTVLQLDVQVDGDMDVLNVKASDGSNIIQRRVGVWKNESNQPQWKLFE